MKRSIFALFAVCVAIAALPVIAVTIGQPAPDFALPDLQGKTQKLSDYAGKFVVLEWVNPECPFVKKHYNSANMPSLQKESGARNVVWLTINSTNPGSSEFKSPAEMKSWLSSKNAAPQAMLFDRDGGTGKTYGAKTTPHMYIVDPAGKLIYAGGIDDKRSTNINDIKIAKNFVRVALDEALAGKPVSVASSVPYGCSIKYAG